MLPPAADRAAAGTTYRTVDPSVPWEHPYLWGLVSFAVICLGRASRREPVRAARAAKGDAAR